uniref:Uncharacterized protein n=1 Tax=Megaselia scalaris TaxID=36166 RepID=T1GFJ7_MEGSC
MTLKMLLNNILLVMLIF